MGRKSSFSLAVTLLACTVTGSAYCLSFVSFCILRFVTAVCNIGVFDVYYVWGVESVGKKYRVMAGFIFQICYTTGCAIFGLIAYYVRDWRTLQLIAGIPLFLFISYYWLVPESIRWLITHQYYDKATKLILNASKVNGKTIPSHLLVVPTNNGENQQNLGDKPDLESNNQIKRKETVVDVLRSRILVKRFIILLVAWTAAVMGYYGITYSANNLSGDFYVNYELVMLIEIPAYICGIYLTDKAGRRPTLSISFIISGIACLITGLVPEDPPATRIVFSLIGKFFISVVFATLYSMTVEVFPTEVRGIMMGFCSTSGRVGGIIAPYLSDAGRRVDPALPFIIFACVNIVVGTVCFMLPETKHATLPANIQEAIELEKYTISLCKCCPYCKNNEDSSTKSTDPLTFE